MLVRGFLKDLLSFFLFISFIYVKLIIYLPLCESYRLFNVTYELNMKATFSTYYSIIFKLRTLYANFFFLIIIQFSNLTRRPIAGHANLCPGSISTKSQELETLLSTVKHEILHALGFSVSLYAFYRDSYGNPLTPRRPDTGKPILNEKYVLKNN